MNIEKLQVDTYNLILDLLTETIPFRDRYRINQHRSQCECNIYNAKTGTLYTIMVTPDFDCNEVLLDIRIKCKDGSYEWITDTCVLTFKNYVETVKQEFSKLRRSMYTDLFTGGEYDKYREMQEGYE